MAQQQNRQRNCCACIFSLGISAFFLWLLLNNIPPICSIEEFDVFALTQNTNSTLHNNTIHYDLKLKNRNINKGIYYDALNLTFYYKPTITNFAVGNAGFSPFYQGYRKSTHRVGNVDVRGVRWENVTVSTVFRAELATRVRYKNPLWKTKRHRLVVGADLKVNDQGGLIKRKGNKGIKLSSGAGKNNMCGSKVLGILGILGILVLIHFL